MLTSHILTKTLSQPQLQGRPLVLALSGGVDSIALLLLLVELRRERTLEEEIQLSAIHVHHGLSDNADAWADFVAQVCQELDVTLTIERVQLIPSGRTSTEQLAREARYQALAQHSPAKALVLTAHHQGDQAETLILRLMRGAGLTGLSGIRPTSDFPNDLGRDKGLTLVRPLLGMSKDELETIAKDRQASWVFDESNLSEDYDRNFVRQSVLPLLVSRWPAASASLARSADLLQQERALLNDYLNLDLVQLLQPGFLDAPCLEIATLSVMPKNKCAALLRLFVYRQANTYPSQNALAQIMTQMMEAEQDRSPEVKIANGHLRRHRGLLYWVGELKFERTTEPVQNGEQVALINPCYTSIEISQDGIAEPDFRIEFGDYQAKFRVRESAGAKPVKQVLKELGCPVWLRPYIPLIFRNDELVAIGDLVIASRQGRQLSVVAKRHGYLSFTFTR